MYKVIIADDNALSIKGMEANLNFETLGAQLVGSFLSGIDAVAYLKEHADVDLLVSDIRMPHMTGLELAREALRLVPQMKIVLISAYDDFEYAQEALRIGVSDYVQKPIQYDTLHEAMQKALAKLEEERNILRRLEEAAPEMRRRFYQDLIQTHPLWASQMLGEEACYLGIATSGGAFGTLAIAGDDNAIYDTQTLLLRTMALQDALQAWMGSALECQLIRERDILLAVLHDESRDVQQLSMQIKHMCHTFAQESSALADGLRFGLGATVDSLWDVPLSMDVARRALNRRFLCPNQNIFEEPAASERSLSFLLHITDSQSEIVQMLLRRDTSSLERMALRLAAEIAAQLKDNSIIIPCLVVLCCGILERIRQDSVNLDGATQTLNAFGAHNRHPVGSQEVTIFLNAFFTQITNALEHSQQSYQQQLIGQVKAYIDNHISDCQLRMESIADEVHVSPSHLSRIFKRVEGINVSDYITNKRIDGAKLLLRTTQDSILQISARVGYASPYYFSACFKKYIGVTPSEFRAGGGKPAN